MEELKVYHAESAGEGIYEEMTELISSDYLEALKSEGCFFQLQITIAAISAAQIMVTKPCSPAK